MIFHGELQEGVNFDLQIELYNFSLKNSTSPLGYPGCVRLRALKVPDITVMLYGSILQMKEKGVEGPLLRFCKNCDSRVIL